MQFFLKLKSWQMFCILVALPFVGQFFVDPFSLAANGANVNEIFLIGGFIVYLSMIIVLIWLWVLGTQLNHFVSEEFRSSPKLFKVATIYPAFYAILFELLFFTQINNPSLNWIPLLICPFHLLALFSILYSFYFISKNLVLAEKDAKVKMEEIIGPFLALLFFPVGVWFIQPRINILYKQNTT